MRNAFRQQTAVVLGTSGSLDGAIEQRLASKALRPLIRYRQDRLAAERPLPMSSRTAETSKGRRPRENPLHSNVLGREGWLPVLSVSR